MRRGCGGCPGPPGGGGRAGSSGPAPPPPAPPRAGGLPAGGPPVRRRGGPSDKVVPGHLLDGRQGAPSRAWRIRYLSRAGPLFSRSGVRDLGLGLGPAFGLSQSSVVLAFECPSLGLDKEGAPYRSRSARLGARFLCTPSILTWTIDKSRSRHRPHEAFQEEPRSLCGSRRICIPRGRKEVFGNPFPASRCFVSRPRWSSSTRGRPSDNQGLRYWGHPVNTGAENSPALWSHRQ